MEAGEQARGDSAGDHGAPRGAATQRPLPPAARRALEEAAARRIDVEAGTATGEQGGRGGLEPVRYGDWEVKGLASDF